MRFIIFAAIIAVLATGCQNFKRVTNLNESADVVRITPEVKEKTAADYGHTELTGAANMLSIIRKACRKDGHFWLKHKNQYEKYLCFPIDGKETHVEI